MMKKMMTQKKVEHYKRKKQKNLKYMHPYFS